ncbi:MAG TPA: hypothetical protein VM012_01475 [Flavitalea sp.]|nr:hypothetical protein [Flavitalea sp.]
MRLHQWLLPVLFLSAVTGSYAQTAEEIINKHIEATGGLEKWNAVKSLYMEGVSVMQNGQEVTSKIYKIQDQLFRRDVDFGMGSMTMLVTDKGGWSSTPRSQGKFEAMPADMYASQLTELDVAGPLVNYAAKGHKASLEGKTTIDGKDAYKIKLTLKSGREQTYYIDSATYYLVRTSFKDNGMMGRGRPQGSDGEINLDYSNFQKTSEGLVFPYTVTVGGMGAAMNYEKIEVNKTIDPKLSKPSY